MAGLVSVISGRRLLDVVARAATLVSAHSTLAAGVTPGPIACADADGLLRR